MAQGSKLSPLSGLNLDLSNQYMQPHQARFIKNLTYQLTDNSQSGATQGSELGVMKPLPSNGIYAPLNSPAGINYGIGSLSSRETAEAYVWAHNSEGNHFIYRINGISQTCEIIKVDRNFNFRLSPEYFIGEGQCWLEVITVVNPETKEQVIKKDLYWTDGINYQGYLRVDDVIATNGFDENKFPYFVGDYNRDALIRMGLPTPKDCIQVSEVLHRPEDTGLNNNLLFQGWQFRVTAIDVYGRPSEHGIITDLYIPGINDCLASSNNLARCLQLLIKVNNPLWDKLQIEYSNQNAQKDNDEPQWYQDTVLELYVGSSLGEWWLRERNTDIPYNPETGQITYEFCRNKECEIIPVSETTKPQPGLSKNSQGIYKQGKRIATFNNKDGFNPFTKELKDKITLEIKPPVPGDNDLRNIEILVPILGVDGTGTGGTSFNSVKKGWHRFRDDGVTPIYFWGGAPASYPAPFGGVATYGQIINEENNGGFIGYLNDGSTAISTQVYVDDAGRLVDDPDHIAQGGDILSRQVFQKFVFNSKNPGNYIFRLADPATNLSNADFKKTSTTVWGISHFQFFGFQVNAYVREPIQELLIDVCEKDYSTLSDDKILVVVDMGRRKAGKSGYISETEENGIQVKPMELIKFLPPIDGGDFTSLVTDHNGFYYIGASGRYVMQFYYQFRNKCGTAQLFINGGSSSGSSGVDSFERENIIIDTETGYRDFSGDDSNRVWIRGRVVLQNTDIGVANTVVTLTRGQQATTDDNGFFAIVAHDDMYAADGIRHDKLVLGAGCAYQGENGECVKPVPVSFGFCTVYNGSQAEREIIVNDIVLNYIIIRSLLSGGTYGLAVNGYDWLGRKTFAQVLRYFTVPSIIESQTIGASTFIVTINPDATFPDDIKYITFSITAETSIETYLDWIVDAVEFIDNRGIENNISPTQVKIFYGSVIEYSKQNNFNTTTAWQFIPENQTMPVINDKVQFFINGDGQFFNKSIIALVKYAQDGIYFTVDYSSELLDLKPDAYMRLIRPKVCTGNEPFYEICNSQIDIVNGKALINQFVLNAFDTYYLNRQIPVPVPKTVDPVPPATEPTITYRNELRILGFKFEHHSPSNFWGYQIWNRGRLNVKNPFEAEILHPNEIALSGALSPTGQLSYLQTFDEEFKTDLNLTDTSGIVFISAKTGILLVVTQYNYAILGYGDNIARVNAQGQVQVPSGADTFGKPERDTVGEYGCQLWEKNTIREYDGLVQWVDASKVAIPQHNFQTCKDVSSNEDNPQQISTIKSWLAKKIQFVRNWNNTNDDKIFFHGGINPVNKEWLLTDFKLGSEDYVNEERCFDVSKRETVAFDIKNKVWKATYSPIPEYWAFLESELNGNQLFAFKKGIPYSHYQASDSDKSCNPFGSSGNPAKWLTERVTKKTTHIGACCPPGWIRDGDTCTRVVRTPATKISDISFIATQVQAQLYGLGGTRIYSTFNSAGGGVFTTIPLTNLFWTNIIGQRYSPLNRVGFWNNTADYTPVETYVPVTLTINVPTDKTYYVGISGDNIFGLTVDCEQLFLTTGAIDYTHWHIYPVPLTAGVHFITLKNKNTGIPSPSNPAAFGFELYDNTAAELTAATSYDDLNLLFTTSSLFGKPVEAFNYTCDGSGCQNVVFEQNSYWCISSESMPIDCAPDTYTYETVDKFIAVNPALQPKFNNFFGVQCERVYEFVYVEDMFNKKRFLAISNYCPESLYFADRIITEEKQQSRLLLSQWRKGEYFSYAGFLADLNTPYDPNVADQTGINKLMDGNQLSGVYIIVRLVGEPKMNAEYSEYAGVTLTCNKVLQSGLPQGG